MVGRQAVARYATAMDDSGEAVHYKSTVNDQRQVDDDRGVTAQSGIPLAFISPDQSMYAARTC